MEKLVSQRTQGFNGGIPQGLSATSEESSKLEKVLRKAVRDERIIELEEQANLTWSHGIKNEDIPTFFNRDKSLGKYMQGCSPDGGIWFNSEGIPVISAEAKKQGIKGNAIERVHKNNEILHSINPYLVNNVFCSGQGFTPNGTSYRTLNTAWIALNHNEEKISSMEEIWNTGKGDTITVSRYPEAFDYQSTYEHMVSIISSVISRYLQSKENNNENQ